MGTAAEKDAMDGNPLMSGLSSLNGFTLAGYRIVAKEQESVWAEREKEMS
jgi:hypothetical protein